MSGGGEIVTGLGRGEGVSGGRGRGREDDRGSRSDAVWECSYKGGTESYGLNG